MTDPDWHAFRIAPRAAVEMNGRTGKVLDEVIPEARTIRLC